jgi:hypothetical protein
MFWSWLFQQILPIGAREGARSYLTTMEHDPTYHNNTQRLEQEIPAARREVNTITYAHAKEYLALEDKRSDSIISRGQGLLVSQAFLGALLSLGGAISSRADLFVGLPLWVTSAIICYIVIQTFLLTRCALISTGAVGYPRVSSSQLANLINGTEDQAVAGLALHSILNYRRTALLNDWRFISLQAAQNSLRNTAVSLGLLVLVVLYLLHSPAPKSPDNTAEIERAQQLLRDVGTRIDRRMGDIGNELADVKTNLGEHGTRADLTAINTTLAGILTRLPPSSAQRYGCIGWQYDAN